MALSLSTPFSKASALALAGLMSFGSAFASSAEAQSPVPKIVASNSERATTATKNAAPREATTLDIGNIQPDTMREARTWALTYQVKTIALLKGNSPLEINPATGRPLTIEQLEGALKRQITNEWPDQKFDIKKGHYEGSNSAVAFYSYNGRLIDIVPMKRDLISNGLRKTIMDYNSRAPLDPNTVSNQFNP